MHSGQLQQIERTSRDGTHSIGRKTNKPILKKKFLKVLRSHKFSTQPKNGAVHITMSSSRTTSLLHLHSRTHTSHCFFFFFSVFGESNFPFTFTNHFTIISASHNTISPNIFKNLSLIICPLSISRTFCS